MIVRIYVTAKALYLNRDVRYTTIIIIIKNGASITKYLSILILNIQIKVLFWNPMIFFVDL